MCKVEKKTRRSGGKKHERNKTIYSVVAGCLCVRMAPGFVAPSCAQKRASVMELKRRTFEIRSWIVWRGLTSTEWSSVRGRRQW